MNIIAPRIVPALSLIALAACGGGGGDAVSEEVTGPTVGTYVDLANTTSTESTPLVYLATNSAGGSFGGSAGTYVRTTDRVDGGAIPGDVTGALASIALDGGGVATLTRRDNAEHVRVLEISGGALSGQVGVVGQPTLTVDMPTTTATINGFAEVTIIDGSRSYDLTGDSIISADFAGGLVDVVLNDLDGTLTDGASAPINVNNVAVIRSDDNAITGSAFDGGTVTISGSGITTSGGESTTSEGQFFGPLADEVGGILIIDDDSGGGDLLLLGRYVGD